MGASGAVGRRRTTKLVRQTSTITNRFQIVMKERIVATGLHLVQGLPLPLTITC